MTATPRSAKEKLQRFVPLVDFFGEALGPSTEIVLHDLTVPDKSIVAIANGHISGRKIGGPVTNLALMFMKQGDAGDGDAATGYRAVNASGRVCRSSSYFIRDDDGELYGMLCVNVDLTEITAAQEATASLPGGLIRDMIPVQQGNPKGNKEVLENLKSTLPNLLDSMLDAAVGTHAIAPKQMGADERISVVSDLEDAGFFLLKGGIASAAERLGVSEPTIYRYLVKVRDSSSS